MCWCTDVPCLIADRIAASSSSSLLWKGKFKKIYIPIYDFARVIQQCNRQWGWQKQGNTVKRWVTLTEQGNQANAQGFISTFLEHTWSLPRLWQQFSTVNLNISSKMWTTESERKQWAVLFPEVKMLRLVCLCIYMTLFCKGKKKKR